MEQAKAYLNGRFLPATELAISPTDTGFVLGAVIAEQLRTFHGQVFRLDDHLARLEHSLEILALDPGMTRQQFTEVALELIGHNYRLLPPGGDLGLSIFVTPGAYPAYSSPGLSRPVVCLHTYPLPFWLWAEKYTTGQALAVPEIRQVPANCWPPTLKCRSRMHYYLADRQAAQIERGSRALLLDQEGFVTEASTANIMVYRKDEGLLSPPIDKVLPGISMAEVNDLAAKLDIPTGHRDLRVDDVATADEVLLTSTPLCLLPVTRLNGHPIADGRPGPLYHRLLAAWNDQVGLDIAAQAEGRKTKDEGLRTKD
ncbi:MAG: aminotransferase class IV [Thermoguttaceae bacterium]